MANVFRWITVTALSFVNGAPNRISVAAQVGIRGAPKKRFGTVFGTRRFMIRRQSLLQLPDQAAAIDTGGTNRISTNLYDQFRRIGEVRSIHGERHGGQVIPSENRRPDRPCLSDWADNSDPDVGRRRIVGQNRRARHGEFAKARWSGGRS
jgi:hypothetical protein